MADKVIKAYLATFDANLRIPYLEKKAVINGLPVIASVYKSSTADKYYCIAVMINNGEYMFEEVSNYSRYYTAEEVMRKDVAEETLSDITQQMIFRKRLLTFISNNPKLPSILSVAYNRNLLVYYHKEGKLRIAKLKGNELILNLPPAEQIYLAELLETFKIKVLRASEVPYEYRIE